MWAWITGIVWYLSGDGSGSKAMVLTSWYNPADYVYFHPSQYLHMIIMDLSDIQARLASNLACFLAAMYAEWNMDGIWRGHTAVEFCAMDIFFSAGEIRIFSPQGGCHISVAISKAHRCGWVSVQQKKDASRISWCSYRTYITANSISAGPICGDISQYYNGVTARQQDGKGIQHDRRQVIDAQFAVTHRALYLSFVRGNLVSWTITIRVFTPPGVDYYTFYTPSFWQRVSFSLSADGW